MTNRGLRIEARITQIGGLKDRGMGQSALFMSLWCRRGYMSTSHHIGIWLKKRHGSYYRIRADELPVRDEAIETETSSKKLLYIARDDDEEEEEEDKETNTQTMGPSTPVRLLF